MKNLKGKLREVLGKLSKSGITEKFYLAGGTALYFRYSHRISEDLDFFLKPDETINFEKLAMKLGKLGEITDSLGDTVSAVVKGIKVSFFEYPYPLLSPLEGKEGVDMAGDIDIACMKSVAIIQRGLKKDFYDLWYLIKIHGWKLRFLIDQCQKKYGGYFNPDVFLKALVFFEDAEKAKVPDIDKKWDEIKKFFRLIVLKEISV